LKPSSSPYGREPTPEAERLNQLALEYQHQLASDVRAVMATPAGRRLLWHLLSGVCGVFATTETGEERSSLLRNGARDAGLRLQHQLQQWAPAEFVLLLGENFSAALERISREERHA
jgi:hypothetical protein